MRKFIAVLLAGAMCLSLAACGSSSKKGAADSTKAAEQSTETSGSDWEYIKGKGEMVVGMTLFEPMNYYDKDNKFVGFDTEVTKAVAKKLGVKVKFTEIDWDSKEIELNSKNIDAIWNGMCSTPERQKNMSCTEPYLYNDQVMVMKKDREKEIISDLKGKTVTCEAGSTGEGKIQGTIPDDESTKVSAKKFFADANYVASDSMAKAVMEVESGTADLAVIDSVCAYGMVRPDSNYKDLVVNADNMFGQQQYVASFRKGSDVTEKVNKALDELYADGTINKIAQKYGLEKALIQK